MELQLGREVHWGWGYNRGTRTLKIVYSVGDNGEERGVGKEWISVRRWEVILSRFGVHWGREYKGINTVRGIIHRGVVQRRREENSTSRVGIGARR